MNKSIQEEISDIKFNIFKCLKPTKGNLPLFLSNIL